MLPVICLFRNLLWPCYLVRSTLLATFQSCSSTSLGQCSFDWCHSPAVEVMFFCWCNSEARYTIALKDAAFDFETKYVQLLVLVFVCVFENTSMGCERFARAVMSPAGQHDDMIREAKMVNTLLLLTLVLAEEERDVCPFWLRLLGKNCLWDCRIACKRRLLRGACCCLMLWGCFSANDQLRHPKDIKFNAVPWSFGIGYFVWRRAMLVGMG